MSDPSPAWLTVIGLGEDGLNGLSPASRETIDRAEVIFGGARHLALVGAGERGREWPLPFSVAPVLEMKPRATVVLASGDPFWHGVGGTLARHLPPDEMRVLPAPSSLSLGAARMGWRLEECLSFGLHAAPFERLTPVLHEGARILCTLRDGAAAPALAAWLTAEGFGASTLTVLEALGGARERVRSARADSFDLTEIAHPTLAAIEAKGAPGLSRASGLSDESFAHDGQITKRPIRALTLSALAPRPGEHLWDLGAGSGSIGIEFALAAPASTVSAVEAKPARLTNITENARRFGLEHRMSAHEGRALDLLEDLPAPDSVFIGGGAEEALLSALWARLAPGTRLVVNAVTLETEALLMGWHKERGGHLLKAEISETDTLGRFRGWSRARPVLLWSVTR